jgi:hypothetical protein
LGEGRTSIHPTIQPFSHPIIQSSRPPAEVAQALDKGDFFLREIIVRGQALYERPD